MVVTRWDFSTPKYYHYDGISTDRDNPRLNANGPIYGAPEESTDLIPVLDPIKHTASQIRHPVNNPETPASTSLPMQPSAYWGAEPIWDAHTSMHNAMMDSEGRALLCSPTCRIGQVPGCWYTVLVLPPAKV